MKKIWLLSFITALLLTGCGTEEAVGFRDSEWGSASHEIMGTEREKGNGNFIVNHRNKENLDYEACVGNNFSKGTFELVYKNIPSAGGEMDVSYVFKETTKEQDEQNQFLVGGYYLFNAENENFDKEALLNYLDEQFGNRINDNQEGAISWENTKVNYYDKKQSSSSNCSAISFSPKEEIKEVIAEEKEKKE